MKLIDNTSIGTQRGMAFVDWRDDSKPEGLDGELREVINPVYAPEAASFGRFLQTLRVASNRSISEVAKELGLTAGRYCDLERGSARPESDDDIRELVGAVLGRKLTERKTFDASSILKRMNKNPPRHCKVCLRQHTADSSCWRPKT